MKLPVTARYLAPERTPAEDELLIRLHLTLTALQVTVQGAIAQERIRARLPFHFPERDHVFQLAVEQVREAGGPDPNLVTELLRRHRPASGQ